MKDRDWIMQTFVGSGADRERKMTEITVALCESFKEIGIDISEADLLNFEKALYERGLNVAPRENPKPSGDASGSYMGTGSAHWNPNLAGR